LYSEDLKKEIKENLFNKSGKLNNPKIGKDGKTLEDNNSFLYNWIIKEIEFLDIEFIRKFWWMFKWVKKYD